MSLFLTEANKNLLAERRLREQDAQRTNQNQQRLSKGLSQGKLPDNVYMGADKNTYTFDEASALDDTTFVVKPKGDGTFQAVNKRGTAMNIVASEDGRLHRLNEKGKAERLPILAIGTASDGSMKIESGFDFGKDEYSGLKKSRFYAEKDRPTDNFFENEMAGDIASGLWRPFKEIGRNAQYISGGSQKADFELEMNENIDRVDPETKQRAGKLGGTAGQIAAGVSQIAPYFIPPLAAAKTAGLIINSARLAPKVMSIVRGMSFGSKVIEKAWLSSPAAVGMALAALPENIREFDSGRKSGAAVAGELAVDTAINFITAGVARNMLDNKSARSLINVVKGGGKLDKQQEAILATLISSGDDLGLKAAGATSRISKAVEKGKEALGPVASQLDDVAMLKAALGSRSSVGKSVASAMDASMRKGLGKLDNTAGIVGLGMVSNVAGAANAMITPALIDDEKIVSLADMKANDMVSNAIPMIIMAGMDASDALQASAKRMMQKGSNTGLATQAPGAPQPPPPPAAPQAAAGTPPPTGPTPTAPQGAPTPPPAPAPAGGTGYFNAVGTAVQNARYNTMQAGVPESPIMSALISLKALGDQFPPEVLDVINYAIGRGQTAKPAETFNGVSVDANYIDNAALEELYSRLGAFPIDQADKSSSIIDRIEQELQPEFKLLGRDNKGLSAQEQAKKKIALYAYDREMSDFDPDYKTKVAAMRGKKPIESIDDAKDAVTEYNYIKENADVVLDKDMYLGLAKLAEDTADANGAKALLAEFNSREGTQKVLSVDKSNASVVQVRKRLEEAAKNATNAAGARKQEEKKRRAIEVNEENVLLEQTFDEEVGRYEDPYSAITDVLGTAFSALDKKAIGDYITNYREKKLTSPFSRNAAKKLLSDKIDALGGEGERVASMINSLLGKADVEVAGREQDKLSAQAEALKQRSEQQKAIEADVENRLAEFKSRNAETIEQTDDIEASYGLSAADILAQFGEYGEVGNDVDGLAGKLRYAASSKSKQTMKANIKEIAKGIVGPNYDEKSPQFKATQTAVDQVVSSLSLKKKANDTVVSNAKKETIKERMNILDGLEPTADMDYTGGDLRKVFEATEGDNAKAAMDGAIFIFGDEGAQKELGKYKAVAKKAKIKEMLKDRGVAISEEGINAIALMQGKKDIIDARERKARLDEARTAKQEADKAAREALIEENKIKADKKKAEADTEALKKKQEKEEAALAEKRKHQDNVEREREKRIEMIEARTKAINEAGANRVKVAELQREKTALLGEYNSIVAELKKISGEVDKLKSAIDTGKTQKAALLSTLNELNTRLLAAESEAVNAKRAKEDADKMVEMLMNQLQEVNAQRSSQPEQEATVKTAEEEAAEILDEIIPTSQQTPTPDVDTQQAPTTPPAGTAKRKKSRPTAKPPQEEPPAPAPVEPEQPAVDNPIAGEPVAPEAEASQPITKKRNPRNKMAGRNPQVDADAQTPQQSVQEPTPEAAPEITPEPTPEPEVVNEPTPAPEPQQTTQQGSRAKSGSGRHIITPKTDNENLQRIATWEDEKGNEVLAEFEDEQTSEAYYYAANGHAVGEDDVKRITDAVVIRHLSNANIIGGMSEGEVMSIKKWIDLSDKDVVRVEDAIEAIEQGGKEFLAEKGDDIPAGTTPFDAYLLSLIEYNELSLFEMPTKSMEEDAAKLIAGNALISELKSARKEMRRGDDPVAFDAIDMIIDVLSARMDSVKDAISKARKAKAQKDFMKDYSAKEGSTPKAEAEPEPSKPEPADTEPPVKEEAEVPAQEEAKAAVPEEEEPEVKVEEPEAAVREEDGEEGEEVTADMNEEGGNGYHLDEDQKKDLKPLLGSKTPSGDDLYSLSPVIRGFQRPVFEYDREKMVYQFAESEDEGAVTVPTDLGTIKEIARLAYDGNLDEANRVFQEKIWSKAGAVKEAADKKKEKQDTYDGRPDEATMKNKIDEISERNIKESRDKKVKLREELGKAAEGGRFGALIEEFNKGNDSWLRAIVNAINSSVREKDADTPDDVFTFDELALMLKNAGVLDYDSRDLVFDDESQNRKSTNFTESNLLSSSDKDLKESMMRALSKHLQEGAIVKVNKAAVEGSMSPDEAYATMLSKIYADAIARDYSLDAIGEADLEVAERLLYKLDASNNGWKGYKEFPLEPDSGVKPIVTMEGSKVKGTENVSWDNFLASIKRGDKTLETLIGALSFSRNQTEARWIGAAKKLTEIEPDKGEKRVPFSLFKKFVRDKMPNINPDEIGVDRDLYGMLLDGMRKVASATDDTDAINTEKRTQGLKEVKTALSAIRTLYAQRTATYEKVMREPGMAAQRQKREEDLNVRYGTPAKNQKKKSEEPIGETVSRLSIGKLGDSAKKSEHVKAVLQDIVRNPIDLRIYIDKVLTSADEDEAYRAYTMITGEAPHVGMQSLTDPAAILSKAFENVRKAIPTLEKGNTTGIAQDVVQRYISYLDARYAIGEAAAGVVRQVPSSKKNETKDEPKTELKKRLDKANEVVSNFDRGYSNWKMLLSPAIRASAVERNVLFFEDNARYSRRDGEDIPTPNVADEFKDKVRGYYEQTLNHHWESVIALSDDSKPETPSFKDFDAMIQDMNDTYATLVKDGRKAEADKFLKSLNKSYNEGRVSTLAANRVLNILGRANPNVGIIHYNSKEDLRDLLSNLGYDADVYIEAAGGEVPYGVRLFDQQGRVYVAIDGTLPNLNTPVHEFAHVWQSANPEAWKQAKEALKATKVGQEYLNRAEEAVIGKGGRLSAYREGDADLRDKYEGEVEDEMLAYFVGDRGEEKFKDPTMRSTVARVKEFYGTLGRKLGVGKVTADTKMVDIVRAIERDLYKGTQDGAPRILKIMDRMQGEPDGSGPDKDPGGGAPRAARRSVDRDINGKNVRVLQRDIGTGFNLRSEFDSLLGPAAEHGSLFKGLRNTLSTVEGYEKVLATIKELAEVQTGKNDRDDIPNIFPATHSEYRALSKAEQSERRQELFSVLSGEAKDVDGMRHRMYYSAMYAEMGERVAKETTAKIKELEGRQDVFVGDSLKIDGVSITLKKDTDEGWFFSGAVDTPAGWMSKDEALESMREFVDVYKAVAERDKKVAERISKVLTSESRDLNKALKEKDYTTYHKIASRGVVLPSPNPEVGLVETHSDWTTNGGRVFTFFPYIKDTVIEIPIFEIAQHKGKLPIDDATVDELRDMAIKFREFENGIQDMQDKGKPVAGKKQSKRHVTGSKSISSKTMRFADALLDGLGYEGADIHILSQRDISHEAMNEIEAFGRRGSLRDSMLHGQSQPVLGMYYASRKDGVSSIVMLGNSDSEAENLLTLSHELGHAFMDSMIAKMTPEQHKAILDDHARWVERNTGKSKSHVKRSQRGGVSPTAEWLPNGDFDPSKKGSFDDYLAGFDEYWADNVTKWVATSEKPRGLIDGLFHNIAKKFQSIYDFVVRNGLYSKNIYNFLDEQFDVKRVKGFDLSSYKMADRDTLPPREKRLSKIIQEVEGGKTIEGVVNGAARGREGTTELRNIAEAYGIDSEVLHTLDDKSQGVGMSLLRGEYFRYRAEMANVVVANMKDGTPGKRSAELQSKFYQAELELFNFREQENVRGVMRPPVEGSSQEEQLKYANWQKKLNAVVDAKAALPKEVREKIDREGPMMSRRVDAPSWARRNDHINTSNILRTQYIKDKDGRVVGVSPLIKMNNGFVQSSYNTYVNRGTRGSEVISKNAPWGRGKGYSDVTMQQQEMKGVEEYYKGFNRNNSSVAGAIGGVKSARIPILKNIAGSRIGTFMQKLTTTSMEQSRFKPIRDLVGVVDEYERAFSKKHTKEMTDFFRDYDNRYDDDTRNGVGRMAQIIDKNTTAMRIDKDIDDAKVQEYLTNLNDDSFLEEIASGAIENLKENGYKGKMQPKQMVAAYKEIRKLYDKQIEFESLVGLTLRHNVILDERKGDVLSNLTSFYVDTKVEVKQQKELAEKIQFALQGLDKKDPSYRKLSSGLKKALAIVKDKEEILADFEGTWKNIKARQAEHFVERWALRAGDRSPFVVRITTDKGRGVQAMHYETMGEMQSAVEEMERQGWSFSPMNDGKATFQNEQYNVFMGKRQESYDPAARQYERQRMTLAVQSYLTGADKTALEREAYEWLNDNAKWDSKAKEWVNDRRNPTIDYTTKLDLYSEVVGGSTDTKRLLKIVAGEADVDFGQLNRRLDFAGYEPEAKDSYYWLTEGLKRHADLSSSRLALGGERHAIAMQLEELRAINGSIRPEYADYSDYLQDRLLSSYVTEGDDIISSLGHAFDRTITTAAYLQVVAKPTLALRQLLENLLKTPVVLFDEKTNRKTLNGSVLRSYLKSLTTLLPSTDKPIGGNSKLAEVDKRLFDGGVYLGSSTFVETRGGSDLRGKVGKAYRGGYALNEQVSRRTKRLSALSAAEMALRSGADVDGAVAIAQRVANRVEGSGNQRLRSPLEADLSKTALGKGLTRMTYQMFNSLHLYESLLTAPFARLYEKDFSGAAKATAVVGAYAIGQMLIGGGLSSIPFITDSLRVFDWLSALFSDDDDLAKQSAEEKAKELFSSYFSGKNTPFGKLTREQAGELFEAAMVGGMSHLTGYNMGFSQGWTDITDNFALSMTMRVYNAMDKFKAEGTDFSAAMFDLMAQNFGQAGIAARGVYRMTQGEQKTKTGIIMKEYGGGDLAKDLLLGRSLEEQKKERVAAESRRKGRKEVVSDVGKRAYVSSLLGGLRIDAKEYFKDITLAKDSDRIITELSKEAPALRRAYVSIATGENYKRVVSASKQRIREILTDEVLTRQYKLRHGDAPDIQQGVTNLRAEYLNHVETYYRRVAALEALRIVLGDRYEGLYFGNDDIERNLLEGVPGKLQGARYSLDRFFDKYNL